MSLTLIILLVEVVLVLLGLTGILYYLPWKRQKIKTAEFDSLLTNFNGLVDERKAQLVSLLEEKYALETKGAEESAGYMIEAEKQFLQQFLIQQIEQKPVNDFYQNLCELLDQYMYFVPTLNNEDNIRNTLQVSELGGVENETLENEVDQEEPTDNSTELINTADSMKDDSEIVTESNDKETSEDILGQSDELSTRSEAENESVSADSDPKQEEFTSSDESETLVTEIVTTPNDSEAEPEPDWGDAFAESGDEVEKTTQAAYQVDENKS